MKLQKAVNEAQRLSNERNIPHVITFDGVEYHILMQRHCRGSFVKLINPIKKAKHAANAIKLDKKKKGQ